LKIQHFYNNGLNLSVFALVVFSVSDSDSIFSFFDTQETRSTFEPDGHGFDALNFYNHQQQ
jgi:hypothetical protein